MAELETANKKNKKNNTLAVHLSIKYLARQKLTFYWWLLKDQGEDWWGVK